MKIKIINGGQPGVEMGALLAAKDLGFPTGGFAPNGYRTRMGLRPKLRDFGIEELPTASYNDAHSSNTINSSATLVLGDYFGNEIYHGIKLRRKKELVKHINSKQLREAKIDLDTLTKLAVSFNEFVIEQNISTLFITGSFERLALGIESSTREVVKYWLNYYSTHFNEDKEVSLK